MPWTVIFYCVLVLGSGFLFYISEKVKSDAGKVLVLGLAFAVAFLPSAIRYNVGTDYPAYINIYSDLGSHDYLEPGFYALNLVLEWLGFPAQSIIVVSAFLFIVFAMSAPINNRGWIIYLSFLLVAYLFSFNGVRQAIALSIGMLSLRFFIQRRDLWFISSVLIGASFHASILILLPIAAFCLIPFREWFKIYVLPMAFAAALLFSYFNLELIFTGLSWVLSTLGFERYTEYFNSEKHFSKSELGSGLGVLSNILFSLYFISRSKDILKADSRFFVFIVCSFCYAFAFVLASQVAIFTRLVAILYVFPAYSAWVLMLCNSKYRQIDRLVAISFILLLFMMFVRNSFGVPSEYTNPMLNPYQTVFQASRERVGM